MAVTDVIKIYSVSRKQYGAEKNLIATNTEDYGYMRVRIKRIHRDNGQDESPYKVSQ